jgi:hypothetical protein
MPIYAGATELSNLGDIAGVYVGDVQVWSAAAPPGSALFDTPGPDSWLCPDGVTSVTVVCIGGGALDSAGLGNGARDGGGGGGLATITDYTVIPGNNYALQVGAVAGDSWFVNTATCRGRGGNISNGGFFNFEGDGSGGSGGNGGQADSGANGGGGGAGGYTGTGGSGGGASGASGFQYANPGSDGQGGGGGGAGGEFNGGIITGHDGGGTVPDGEGVNGTGGFGTGGDGSISGENGPYGNGQGGRSGDAGANSGCVNITWGG